MVAPAVIALMAAAVAAGAKYAGDAASARQQAKAAKKRAKETKRETYAGLLNEAAQRNAELQAQELHGRKKLGVRGGQSLQETSDLVRGALRL